MKTLRLVALSLATAGLLAGSTLAAEKTPSPQEPTKAGNVKVTPPPANVKPVPAAYIDQCERLEEMVKEMGVNYEKLTDEKVGVVFFSIKEYGSENYCFDLEESKSKKYTWICFPCGKMPETGMPADVMEKLLHENTKMSTASFQYYPKTRMLFLKMPLSNASLDAKSLKQEINWLMKDATRTRPLWDSTKWDKNAGND